VEIVETIRCGLIRIAVVRMAAGEITIGVKAATTALRFVAASMVMAAIIAAIALLPIVLR
jgi:hypothetical protein